MLGGSGGGRISAIMTCKGLGSKVLDFRGSRARSMEYR